LLLPTFELRFLVCAANSLATIPTVVVTLSYISQLQICADALHFAEVLDTYLPGGKDGRCVGLTTLPPSSADCVEILAASTSWNPKGLSRPVAGKLCLYLRGTFVVYN
jgi:hypothetical protein